MRRLSAALISLVFIAQPLSAFAAYDTPGALMQAVQFDGSAKTVSAEIHGSQGTTYVTAWINGSMEGTVYPDIKATAKVTFDVVDDVSHMKARVKGSVVLVDGQIYVQLESLNGTFDDEMISGVGNLMVKKWITMAGDADTASSILNMLQQTIDPASADSLFTISQHPYQYGTRYVLTPTSGDTNSTIIVDADYKDTVQVVKVSFDGSMDGFSFHGGSKSQRMTKLLTITAPTGAISVDELMQHMTTIGTSGLLQKGSIPDVINMPFDSSSTPSQSKASDASSESSSSSSTSSRSARFPLRVLPSSSSSSSSSAAVQHNYVKSTQTLIPVDRVGSGVSKPSERLLQQGNGRKR